MLKCVEHLCQTLRLVESWWELLFGALYSHRAQPSCLSRAILLEEDHVAQELKHLVRPRSLVSDEPDTGVTLFFQAAARRIAPSLQVSPTSLIRSKSSCARCATPEPGSDGVFSQSQGTDSWT